MELAVPPSTSLGNAISNGVFSEMFPGETALSSGLFMSAWIRLWGVSSEALVSCAIFRGFRLALVARLAWLQDSSSNRPPPLGARTFQPRDEQ